MIRKKIKALLSSAAITVALVGLTPAAAAYTINDEFNLAPNEGDSRIASGKIIVLHETANPRATGRNEATYMKRNFFNAYTTAIVGDGGIVYRVGEEGYVSWGALNANPYAHIQIELQHTTDRATFEKNYRAYVEYARDMADKYSVEKTLDSSNIYNGFKSHAFISEHFGGDHTDPYGYLAKMGVSRTKLAHDLANGFGSEPVMKPAKPQTHDQAVLASPAKKQGNDYGKLEYFNCFSKDQIRVAGWLAPTQAVGRYEYVLFMEHGTNKEITRVQSRGIDRPDVKKAYGLNCGQELGFDVTVDTKLFKGKKIDVILRRANKENGEKPVNDVRLSDIYLSF